MSIIEHEHAVYIMGYPSTIPTLANYRPQTSPLQIIYQDVCWVYIALCYFVLNPLSLGMPARRADLKLKTLNLKPNYEPLMAR